MEKRSPNIVYLSVVKFILDTGVFDEELRDYASAQIKKELKGMKPVFAAIADITEDETGIEGIKVRISYKDKSGYILYRDTISPDN